jgi:hypothetical protein
MNHPWRDTAHIWWPIPTALALVAVAGVAAIVTAMNGVSP